jgi:phosphatidylglycerol:prolipoprotein diacylglycerol transferase
MLMHNLNPVLLDLGFAQIRYYGLFYVIGFLFSIWWVRKYSKLNKDLVYDMFFYLIVGLITGARLFEIFIWQPAYYFSNPLEMLMIWHGGLSFHGGLIGTIIAAILYCRKKKISFLQIADILVLPACFAMALVRIGNFINGELYGTISNLPWCVKFPGADGCRHPSQIYESIYNIINFAILWTLSTKKHKDGFIFAAFLFFYGIFRFVTEFVRFSEWRLFDIFSTGQILCALMIATGAVMMWKLKKK